MPVRTLLLAEVVTGILSVAGAPALGPAPAPSKASEPRVFAVLEELDRISKRPLWPGFDPRGVPVAVFDGGRTWLVRHPSPPADFHPWPGRAGVLVFEGRHESQRANTAVALAGVMTATASLDGHPEGPRSLAGLLVHEIFHVFQARRHPKWGGNEVEQLVYPSDDAEALALRRLESAALRRALAAGSGPSAVGWAARALAARGERFARLPASAAAYERGTEMKEGLALYVETKAAGGEERLLPENEFPPEAVRLRAYDSGAAIALLLDRFDPGWKLRAEETDDTALDERLRRAVAKTRPGELAPGEEDAARRRAAEDIEAMGARRAALRREFLAAPGWTLVVESGAPLFPQGFDPWNVDRLSATEVLHTRWIKLGNTAGSLEVLDRRCLTEGAGRHPLFEGIRRATITALPSEPRVEEAADQVRIDSNGIHLDLRGARVSRSARTLTLTLAP